MSGVDDARMSGSSKLTPGTSVFGVDVECNRHDDCTAALDLGVKRLPPGQAGAAASITGPGDQHHLLATQ